METSRWNRLEELFHDGIALAPEEREPFIERHSGDDAHLRFELRLMLLPDGGTSGLTTVGLGEVARGEVEEEELPAQQVFGPYRLVRLLGAGGMGRVYLACRDDLGSFAAIKLLRQANTSPEAREHFSAEQRIVAQLTHPLIARLYDASVTADGVPYFVMEFVDGLPLTQFCDDRGYGLRQRLELFSRVCEAVRYSHRQAVVHRDIKPSNILVTPDGTPKLLDFGIANRLGSSNGTGSEEASPGLGMSPPYASPEQLSNTRPGLQSDIYSLGVVLYELLTGILPLPLAGLSRSEAQRLVCESEIPPPSRTLESGTSAALSSASRSERADLDALCLKALQKDPENRYLAVDAFLEDIQAFLDTKPLVARPTSWRYRASKFLKRNRKLTSATVAVVALVATLSGTFVWRLAQERKAALEEAAHAQRLLEFSLNLFSGGEDEAAPPASMRVQDVLDRGVREASILKDDPTRQSEMYLTLGSLYSKMGDMDKGENLTRNALTIRERAFGPASQVVGETLLQIGLIHSEQDRFNEADKEIHSGIDILSRVHGPRHPDVLQSKVSLGQLLLSRGEYKESVAILEPVVQQQQIAGSSGEDRASGLFELSSAYYYLGDYANAEKYLKGSVAIETTLYGAEHPAIAEDELQLCSILAARHQLDEAETACRTGWASDKAWYGPDSPVTAFAATTFASILTREEKTAEARTLLTDALRIQLAAYGEVHQRVAGTLVELGSNAADTGDLQAAESDYNRALAIYRKTFGDRSSYVATALSELGEVANKRKDYPVAEKLVRQALDIYIATEGPQHTNVGDARLKMGHILLRENKFADAKQETQAGYDILFRQTEPKGAFYDMATKDLAEENAALAAQPKSARSLAK